MHWLYLGLAIIGEVIGTASLQASHGFTRLWPSLACLAGYGVAFFLLSIVLKTLPVGITYAIWSGAGVALIALIGYFVFGQRLDGPALFGIGLIVSGVIVLNTLSSSVSGH